MHPGDTTAMRQPRTTAWKQSGSMIEMTMEGMKACTTYRFTIEVKTVSKSGSREVEKNLGTIRDVVLPPMAFVSSFKLPLLSKVIDGHLSQYFYRQALIERCNKGLISVLKTNFKMQIKDSVSFPILGPEI